VQKRFLLPALLLALLCSFSGISRAATPDEGMWIPLLLKKYNEADMKRLGFKLTAEDVYDINHASLKDAIVRLGDGFCTAELVSKQGMLFTNHHCGYEAIASVSSKDHNYLDNGFFAKTLAEEIQAPDVSASILQEMRDVSARVADSLKGITDQDKRSAKARSVGKSIVTEILASSQYPKADGFTAEVKPFFDGNQYFLMIYRTYRDVRLVGCPPSSIGKFGGDTDNWMWPRHTGDFSILRIYMGKDGKPADFNTANVPFQPKRVLPISLNGYTKGDYTMVMGYPGTTNRYLTSFSIENSIHNTNPAIINVFGKQLENMKRKMDKDVTVRLEMAGDYASLANTWKYYLGQTNGLKTSDVVASKRAAEVRFTQWVNENPARKEKYGTVLEDLKQAYLAQGPLQSSLIYLSNAGMQSLAFEWMGHFSDVKGALDQKAKKDRLAALGDSIRKKMNHHFGEEFNFAEDRADFGSMLVLMLNNITPNARPEFLKEIAAMGKNNTEAVENWLKANYDISIFTDRARSEKFLKKPSVKAYDADPLVKYSNAIQAEIVRVQPTLGKFRSQIAKGRRIYTDGLLEMQPNARYYPDANSTLRISYGTVQPYNPRDAVFYNYQTTIDGIIEKEDSTNEEFVVPKELKRVFAKLEADRKQSATAARADFMNGNNGSYVENNSVPTCFLTTNDITGGNSGSPVMNANGELIGLAFDGNWESMTGDLQYSPTMQRTIVVDIRYVLLTIDKMFGASRIMSELTYAPMATTEVPAGGNLQPENPKPMGIRIGEPNPAQPGGMKPKPANPQTQPMKTGQPVLGGKTVPAPR